MTKRLLLHIGTGKTGTSSIQNCLFENRHFLTATCGIFYPEYGLSQIEHFGDVINAHYPVVFWATQGDTLNLNALLNEFERSNCQLLVLSCEDFYHHLLPAHIAYLAQVFNYFSVEIICYVRRQDLYMESAWKQQVKVGQMRTSFQDFLKWHTDPEHLDKVHGNYYRMLKPWAEAFGIDAIRVKVFDKTEWLNGDLIDDFLNAAGIDFNQAKQLLVKSPSTTNAALPSELMKLIQKINALRLILEKDQQGFIDYLNGLTSFQDPPLLSNLDRRAILKNYRRSNRLLFEEFCKRPIPQCFLPSSIIPEQRKTSPRLLEDVAILCLTEAWKQTKLAPQEHNRAAAKPVTKYRKFFKTALKTILPGKNQTKAVSKTLDPNKPAQLSPFVLNISSSPIAIEEDRQIFCYGFPTLPKLKTSLLSELPQCSMTANDCFISAADYAPPADSQALLGGLYENGLLIQDANYRGITAKRAIDPASISQAQINKSLLIREPCIYLGWLSNYFGHILLEAPARFWILKSLDISQYKFIYHPLSHRRGPILDNVFEYELAQTLFDCFGIRKNQIILANQDLCAEHLIIPSSMFFLSLTVDPGQLSIYDRIKAYSLRNRIDFAPGRKIYLSRCLLKKTNGRKAINEESIEQLFVAYGFEIVFPELLSWQEQIRLMSEANIIAGCEGSALHMGLFSPPDTKMIVLSSRNIVINQLLINKLSKIETHLINAGKDRSIHITGNWEADIDFIKENLNQIMRRVV